MLSVPEKGTEVIVRLPLAEASAASTAADEAVGHGR
jgi:hypothetical protein